MRRLRHEVLLTGVGIEFPCSSSVVPYPVPPGSDSFVCSVVGAIPGSTTVLGDRWINTSYSYEYDHLARNIGILLGFLVFFLVTYLVITEWNTTSAACDAAVLLFKRDASKSSEHSGMHKPMEKNSSEDEAGLAKDGVSGGKNIFSWKGITYDIPIKGSDEPRRLLDDISGWVEPGTLTALMGSSGAGKTTLLDVLAQRTSIGVVTGERAVNGRPLDSTFQRSTGYVQQQDLHLATTTVR